MFGALMPDHLYTRMEINRHGGSRAEYFYLLSRFELGGRPRRKWRRRLYLRSAEHGDPRHKKKYQK